MAKIKICGLKREEDILAVNEALPDYCGFVVEVAKSRRSVSRERLRELLKGLRSEICPVGVFVDSPPELVAELLEEGSLAVAQLHGKEDEVYIERLRSLTKKPLIQAFSIKNKDDMEKAAQSSADCILLDQGGGGTGRVFDWSLVSGTLRPFFLAGGLSVENLKEAIERLKPFAVDLSSSLETDGVKDPAKIKQAVELVRKLG